MSRPDYARIFSRCCHAFEEKRKRSSCPFVPKRVVKNYFDKIGLTNMPLATKGVMYCLKHEQQCFIGCKNTRRSRVFLNPIKHVLRVF